MRKGPYSFTLEIAGLAERRGSVEQAQRLYVEEEESQRLREETRQQLAADRAAAPRPPPGAPAA